MVGAVLSRAVSPVSYAATAVASGRRNSVQYREVAVCQPGMIRLTDFSDRERHESDPENGPCEKPKGMHWKTFERLCEEDERLEEVVDWHLARKLGALGLIDI